MYHRIHSSISVHIETPLYIHSIHEKKSKKENNKTPILGYIPPVKAWVLTPLRRALKSIAGKENIYRMPWFLRDAVNSEGPCWRGDDAVRIVDVVYVVM